MANTSLIGLTLPTQGTLSGTWGDTVNNAISEIVDAAVAGTQVISVDADITLAVTTGTAVSTGLTGNSSQYAVIRWTAGGTVTRTITVPAQSKTYVVINNTTSTQSITIKAATGTGVTLAAGTKAIVAWDGTNFVNVGGGLPAGSNTQIQFNNSGAFGASSGLTWDGTTLTANDLIDSSLTASKPVFTNGTKNLVSTGTLGADQGGTGLATLTANNVLLGNGTSAVQFVAPGTNGNVLVSNGTTWTSAAPAASGVTQAKATMINFIFSI
jgi:hypothetical protein